MKILFVSAKEKVIDLDNYEIIITGKKFDVGNNHIEDTMRVKYYSNDYSYERIARELLNNLGRIDKIIFDSRVIYNRDGTEGIIENTHTEKIRQEFNNLLKV